MHFTKFLDQNNIENKILIIFSDGAATDSGNAIDDEKYLKEKYGVKIISIYINSDSQIETKMLFGKDHNIN